MVRKPSNIYKLDKCSFPTPPYLTNKEYGKAIQSFIRVCSDIVFVNSQKKVLYLVRRIIPNKGWWWFGGRIFPGESELIAAKRILERETLVKINPKRLKYLRTNHYRYADEKGKPPHDDETHTFVIETTEKEVRKTGAKLDPKEYDCSTGIQEFDRKRLISERVCQPVREIYDVLFPQEKGREG